MPRFPSALLTRLSVPRATIPARAFHRSSIRLATEVPPNFSNDARVQQLQEQLTKSPEAMDAIANLAKVMQSKGFDTTHRPGPMEMVKLGMDKEVREAASKMMETCQKAGIKLDPESIQALASKLGP